MNRYQTFWLRVGSSLVDSLVFAPLFIAEAFLRDLSHRSLWWIAWELIKTPIFPVYSVLMVSRYGATVGKMAAGIKILDVTESRYPTLKQAALREIGNITIAGAALIYRISLIATHRYSMQALSEGLFPLILNTAAWIWLLLEFVTMFRNEKRRALHDLIGGTVVVRMNISSADYAAPPQRLNSKQPNL